MHTEQCTYKGCDTRFTKPNRGRAVQAIKMHIARTHTKTIMTPTGPQNAGHHRHQVNGNGNGHTGILVATPPSVVEVTPHGHCRFTAPELTGILDFLRKRRSEFPTKHACFEAALEANNATGRIVANSVAVNRYFEKAAKLVGNSNGKSHGKRKYTRRTKPGTVAAPAAPAATAGKKTINFCENCGHSIKVQALGSVLAERILAGAVVTVDGERLNYVG